jgi:hypothetical protein
MKRIMKKLKDIIVSITFAEPDEYDSTQKQTKGNLKIKKKSKKKKGQNVRKGR